MLANSCKDSAPNLNACQNILFSIPELLQERASVRKLVSNNSLDG